MVKWVHGGKVIAGVITTDGSFLWHLDFVILQLNFFSFSSLLAIRQFLDLLSPLSHKLSSLLLNSAFVFSFKKRVFSRPFSRAVQANQPFDTGYYFSGDRSHQFKTLHSASLSPRSQV